MNVFCCQLDIVWEDKKANYDLVRRLLAKETIPENSLIVLPEMFATGFSMNATEISEEPDGPTDRWLAALAREYHAYVVGGLVRSAPAGKGLNQAVAYSPTGAELTRYSKIQPFNLGGEGDHYVAGDAPTTFRWEQMLAAPFVCYDLRFPELFRASVKSGTQLFVVIANWPVKRIHHWVMLLQARAIENLAYVVGVNRAGQDPQFNYTGRSLVVDPHGTILADAGEGPGVIRAEVKVAVVEEWRAQFPALRDMHR